MHSNQGIYVELEELLSLQERARHISDSMSVMTQNMLQGNRPSKVHGRGGAFDQIRNYLAGDDVRNIDWNVTARMGKPFVRVFNEERETPLLVLVDQSSNMFFSTRKQMKSVVAAEIASYVLWMSHHLKRPSGGIIFNNENQILMRPRANKSHLYGFLEQLSQYNQLLATNHHEQLNAANTTHGLKPALQQLNQVAVKDAFVVIISDFIDIDAECWHLIERLRYQCNVIAMPIHDGILDTPPDEGQFLARYANVQAELDFTSAHSREKILKGGRGRIAMLHKQLSQFAIPALTFSTYQDVEKQLLKGLFVDGGNNG